MKIFSRVLVWGTLASLLMAAPVRADDAAGPPVPADPAVKFKRVGAATKIPWFYLAAIFQYETSLHRKNKQQPGQSSIELPARAWCGTLNPNQEDRYEGTIRVYHGIGRDGDRDGLADPRNETDILYALAALMGSSGSSEQDIRISLWNHYQDTLIVDRITHFARIYNQFKTTELKGNCFPIPKQYNYTYRSTWGDRRGWGGRRMHEGTDIFAGYGTPVLATSYGFVEMKGWNEYGGWRIGIRDLNNVYHYYAHLSSYAKGLQIGSTVTPGQVIGYVGSSGYGRPGTSGKFAPHLHYGMYRDTGKTEYAFDPTPLLRRWEKQAKAR
jgi:murein DD-endopeptidase MepM/ murein hydrolase activator NlpD